MHWGTGRTGRPERHFARVDVDRARASAPADVTALCRRRGLDRCQLSAQTAAGTWPDRVLVLRTAPPPGDVPSGKPRAIRGRSPSSADGTTADPQGAQPVGPGRPAAASSRRSSASGVADRGRPRVRPGSSPWAMRSHRSMARARKSSLGKTRTATLLAPTRPRVSATAAGVVPSSRPAGRGPSPAALSGFRRRGLTERRGPVAVRVPDAVRTHPWTEPLTPTGGRRWSVVKSCWRGRRRVACWRRKRAVKDWWRIPAIEAV